MDGEETDDERRKMLSPSICCKRSLDVNDRRCLTIVCSPGEPFVPLLVHVVAEEDRDCQG